MRLTSLLLMTAATFALGLASQPAGAQGHQGTRQEQQACSRDASRFCRSELGNDFAVQSCLQAHRAKLSKSCSRVFQSHGM
jgi:hypothetical protein